VSVESWGRTPRAVSALHPVRWRAGARLPEARPLLAFGLGRSYGDSCLNDGGTVLLTRGLDRFVAFDRERGLLTCEAGVSLGEILELVAPLGFFLPVVPGTKHVTVGGAIANDVHGKNHHRAGTFGCHVVELELLRSTGDRFVCGPERNRALFEATVGGLGLTGLILAATLRLRRIPSPWVTVKTTPLRGLGQFFELRRAADEASEFTVAWIDCVASGAALGRGLLFEGSWSARAHADRRPAARRLAIPFELSVSPLNRVTLKAFNGLYYTKNRLSPALREAHHEPFFFPLDGVERWNRIYGRGGLFQFQCAVADDAAPEAIRAMLGAIARAGEGSFLGVLKGFGDVASPGLLSFPRAGVTLALDFPNKGAKTLRLMAELYAMVRDHGGRLYPGKDALMPGEQFRAQYAEVLPAFREAIDPAFSSSFWRRVNRG
jgi:FAD/FMN-containing dehydrogenase